MTALFRQQHRHWGAVLLARQWAPPSRKDKANIENQQRKHSPRWAYRWCGAHGYALARGRSELCAERPFRNNAYRQISQSCRLFLLCAEEACAVRNEIYFPFPSGHDWRLAQFYGKGRYRSRNRIAPCSALNARPFAAAGAGPSPASLLICCTGFAFRSRCRRCVQVRLMCWRKLGRRRCMPPEVA